MAIPVKKNDFCFSPFNVICQAHTNIAILKADQMKMEVKIGAVTNLWQKFPDFAKLTICRSKVMAPL